MAAKFAALGGPNAKFVVLKNFAQKRCIILKITLKKGLRSGVIV